MKKIQRIRGKSSLMLYLLITIVVFLGGAAGSYFYFKPKLLLEIPLIKDLATQKLKGLSSKEESSSLIPKESLIVHTSAKEAIKKYLDPYNAKVLEIYADNEGVIHVNLSSDLKKNFNGDISEEYSIISSLYNTIKGTVPGFTKMKILIDGREVDTFGGHIDISRPIEEDIVKSSGGDDA
ncbi:MAG: GerMN domain-containing protein [Nitrospirae bacterium]|nr:GerMN domain-containing protein [Nitrospirota bacterium]